MSTRETLLLALFLLALWWTYTLTERFGGHGELPKVQRVGIVSMMKDPHQLGTWLRYHLSIGADKLYIFVDDPSDYPTFANEHNSLPPDHRANVDIVVMDHHFLSTHGYAPDPTKDNPQNWNVRQDIAVDAALEQAAADGIDVLLHIDADELLYSHANKPLADAFESVSDGVTFEITNYEIAPDSDSYENCFLEANHFRTDASTFVAYGNGKGGGRVGMVRSHGPHRMAPLYADSTTHRTIDTSELVVLHFVSCNLNETLKKYKMYADFSSQHWEWATHHLQARDALNTCSSDTDCQTKAKALFHSRLRNERDNTVELDIQGRLH